MTDKFYRTEMNYLSLPREHKSNFNRFSGVFCHRGFYDQAMKIPENSVLAIDYGFTEYGFRLHELDVKLHTNADKSLNLRKAFLSHDATGARTTAQAGRWSQNDGRDVIGTILVTKGINLEKNDFASTFQETDAKVPGLESLLADYDREWVSPGKVTQLLPSDYSGSTFQLDVSQPGDAFARMLAWFRHNKFNTLQVIIKGYNRFYPDGPALLEAVNKSFALQSGALIDTFRAHDKPVASATYVDFGAVTGHHKIVTGSRDKTVRIWEFQSGALERTLVGHGGAVNSVTFSSDDAWVVSGSDDATVRIWDFCTGNLIHELKGHKGAVNCVAFSDLHRLVASASDDRKVLIWHARTGKLRHALKGHKAPVTSVVFWDYDERNNTMVGSSVASGSLDGTIRIWATKTGSLLRTLAGHTDAVTCMALADVGVLATGSFDRTIRIWEISTGELLHTLGGHQAPVTSVAWARENTGDMHVASASGNTVRIWHVETGQLLRTFQGHTADVISVTFARTPSATVMLTASSDGEVRIWAYQTLIDIRMRGSGPWQNLKMGVIIVFYPQPILDIALAGKGLALKTTSPEERLEVLDYEYLTKITRDHICSFIDNPIPEFGPIIPEIVHCGLGLGYDTNKGTAVNPKDGSAISDQEVLLSSRLDRALIEVSLELRKLHPLMVFSSCTRLSDVYFKDSDAEFTADLLTGLMKPKLTGEHGIPARLRALHGGLYPQSDLVVADDPIAEIAARTWIDEYAQLDRAQLLTMTYDEWIAQDPAVKKVVDGLNAKFWPNTVGGTVDAQVVQEQEYIVSTAGFQGQREEDGNKAKDTGTGPQREEEKGKRKWWKKF
ncbi:WD40-repeat-containing domain protein [Parachaetomium inaequale]|uniref:WD40-repeat-containing domain protein n=1 Tax=Parachaetomium inaequale TaxID=2588326 RepID=A0AAN6P636_9PEZI|nr:WD40-repeat-containing domain protein [Parachaetomium inaequale]